MKKRTVSFRVDEDTARYIDLAVSYHNCTKTDFITKQVIRPEFIEVKFEDVKPLLNLMSNVSSNINQIARALNIIKKKEDKMTAEEYQNIRDIYEELKHAFGLHDDQMQKCLLGYYKLSKKKKIRPIEDEDNDEFSNIANEGAGDSED